MHERSGAGLARRAAGWLRRRAGVYSKPSWSQCGEDLIVAFVLDTLGVPRPSYLDLGAHHAYYLNNTYLFYRRGARGVNVEADPVLAKRLQRARPRDITVNAGVGPEAGALQFHIMSAPTLNTFSAEEAKRYCNEGGHRIERTLIVEVYTFAQLIEAHCDGVPDFVSLDVEGLDLPVLRSIDFARHHPLLFCVETLSYSESGQGRHVDEIDELMDQAGYLRYADTHINTIYVDEARWRRR